MYTKRRIVSFIVVTSVILLIYHTLSQRYRSMQGNIHGELRLDNDMFASDTTVDISDNSSQSIHDKREPANERETISIDNKSINESRRRPNVLFIMGDEFRPQLSVYHPQRLFGKTMPITPNLDKLATRSLVLTRMYAQYSLCGPSRSSLLTSRRPDSIKIWTNHHNFRNFVNTKNITTLPEYFKECGYKTLGYGKIFHHRDNRSWSETDFQPIDKFIHTLHGADFQEVEETEENTLEDELVNIEVIQRLSQLTEDNQPFFLAVGYSRPHVPMVCPKRFFDLYPEEPREFLVDPRWQNPMVDPETHLYHGTGERINEPYLRQLRRAYFACVSYIDELIGDLLKALDELGASSNTIVAFTSDHGFHLGENDFVGKARVFETSLWVPLMLRIPRLTDGGIVSSAVHELVDLFPTLVDAAGLPMPPPCPPAPVSSSIPLCTEGTSFLPLVAQPRLNIKTTAISQVNHGTRVVSYAQRTRNHRYVETVKYLPSYKVEEVGQNHIWGPTRHSEAVLFDLNSDPLEQNNILPSPSMKRRYHHRLSQMIQQQPDNIYFINQTIPE